MENNFCNRNLWLINVSKPFLLKAKLFVKRWEREIKNLSFFQIFSFGSFRKKVSVQASKRIRHLKIFFLTYFIPRCTIGKNTWGRVVWIFGKFYKGALGIVKIYTLYWFFETFPKGVLLYTPSPTIPFQLCAFMS